MKKKFKQGRKIGPEISVNNEKEEEEKMKKKEEDEEEI
jgi:hypothetical protein